MHTKRLTITYVALAAALLGLFALNLFWGSVAISPRGVVQALLGRGQDELAANILLQLRLPRAVMVVLLGAALSVAGYLLQTFFANPIAGPFVMGISSGAKLVVALTMVVFLNHGLLTNSLTLILAAFAGSMAAMAFVLSVARRVHRMSILVICGVMIGYICSAVTDIVVAFAQDSNIVNLHNWSMGSFSGMTWGNVAAAALVVLPCLAAAFLLAKPMAAYQMGEQYAQSVGVAVRPFCVALVLLSSLLAACVTAFAGPISFVGIAVPHLVKQALGSAKPLHVLPGCALGGAAFCLLCDLIARSLFAPTELSISSVTAVFGAPVVIWLLVRRQSGRAGHERSILLPNAGSCHWVRQNAAITKHWHWRAARADLSVDWPQRRGQIHPAQNAGRAAGGAKRRCAAAGPKPDNLHPQCPRAQNGPDAAPHPPHRADHLF